MTDQNYPITPPPELVEQWYCNKPLDRGLTLATWAAQWGADQELEACCEWLKNAVASPAWVKELRAARRPKPPSDKELALLALTHLDKGAQPQMDTTEAVYTIRRALEALDE